MSNARRRGVLVSAPLDMDPRVDVAGVDVGLTLLDRSSGVCRTGVSGDFVTHTYMDRFSRLIALGANSAFAVLAIDAPVLPRHQLHYNSRACEKIFVWRDFQRRCKPGESDKSTIGTALRRGGVETAHSLEHLVARDGVTSAFPKVFSKRNIVEAFPNAFLGVLLPSAVFINCPNRTKKFDWLYEEWNKAGGIPQLRAVLNWPRERFWEAVITNGQHDERAALVCAFTALCVLRGDYVAVGNDATGYFFLPPWSLWQPWARSALDTNRRDPRLPAPVNVWINGTCYSQQNSLCTPSAMNKLATP